MVRKVTVEVLPEDTIDSLDQLMFELYRTGVYVYAEFEGVALTVHYGDVPGDVIRKYEDVKGKGRPTSMTVRSFFSKERLRERETSDGSASRAHNALWNEFSYDGVEKTMAEFLEKFSTINEFRDYFIRMPNVGPKSVELLEILIVEAGMSFGKK